MIALVIALLALIASLDLPRLLREKNQRALTVYALCFTAVAVYMLLFAFDVKFVNSLEVLHQFFENVLGLTYERFGR